MCPSLTCSTVCHSNNSVTYNPLASALVINSMQSLTPYIWPGSMHWLFMHSQKQRGWQWIKRPNSHAVTRASCRRARDPGARASAHTPSRHNQPEISWPRDVFEAVAPELTHRRDLCEKRLEWVPEENSWGRGMLCTSYRDTVIHSKKHVTERYPPEGCVYLISDTQRAFYWLFMGVSDVSTDCQTPKRTKSIVKHWICLII